MNTKNIFLNYLGQIRLYSLVDLILLLIAIHAKSFQFIGVILLHLGFILFLEYNHKHSYRIPFPTFLWIILTLLGIILYKNFVVIGFLIFSFLYTKKKSHSIGMFAPLFRGMQSYFLTSGILGFLNPLCLVSGILLMIRNFAGDLRDVVKDKKEGLRTLPIVFGFKKDLKYLHLIALLLISSFWWYISGISFLWLIIVYLIEIGTYYLTPR